MFDPMRALFASSFSKKGISEAATDTNCLGDTSINWIFSLEDNSKLRFFLQATNSSTNDPSLFTSEFA